MEDLQNLFALSAVPQIGAGRLRILITEFGSPSAVFQAKPSEIARVKGISKNIANDILKNQYQEEAAKRLKAIKNGSIKVLTIWDEGYPLRLKNIHSPPAILYYCGEFDPKDINLMAVVGTRRPSEYGLTIAASFSEEMAGMGITIVSGLAVGIDTAAHRGALKGRGRTIAVLGSGLDRLYPAENKSLAREIVKQGVVITEYPPGTSPDPANFPQRNRIISGLSPGVVIIEASKKKRGIDYC